jgi:hypothetical protein
MTADWPLDPQPYHARLGQPPREPGGAEPDRGVCGTADGREHQLVSGFGDRLSGLVLSRLRGLGVVDDRHVPEIAGHVELKAALCVRECGSKRRGLVLGGAACVGLLGGDMVLSGAVPALTRWPVGDAQGCAVVVYLRHEHAEEPVVARTLADANRLVDRLLAEPYSHSVAALYAARRPPNRLGFPDHELRGQRRRRHRWAALHGRPGNLVQRRRHQPPPAATSRSATTTWAGRPDIRATANCPPTRSGQPSASS